MIKVTEKQKREVPCPECGRGKGRPCVSSRIPSANSFGGGWGGPPDLDTAHAARRSAWLAQPYVCVVNGVDVARFGKVEEARAFARHNDISNHNGYRTTRVVTKDTVAQ